MKIIIFLFILLITNAYSSTDSECIDTKNSSRRLASDFDDDYCIQLETSDKERYVCVASSDNQYCEEMSLCFAYARLYPENLDLNECYDLPTSKDDLYRCVPSDKECIELDECTGKYYENYLYYNDNENSRRLSTDYELTEEDCALLAISDDLRYKCVPGPDNSFCEKIEKTCLEVSQKSAKYSTDVLSDEDCKFFKTSNDKRYECALSSDGTSCEEKKTASDRIKLSISILILLFFF